MRHTIKLHPPHCTIMTKLALVALPKHAPLAHMTGFFTFAVDQRQTHRHMLTARQFPAAFLCHHKNTFLLFSSTQIEQGNVSLTSLPFSCILNPNFLPSICSSAICSLHKSRKLPRWVPFFHDSSLHAYLPYNTRPKFPPNACPLGEPILPNSSFCQLSAHTSMTEIRVRLQLASQSLHDKFLFSTTVRPLPTKSGLNFCAEQHFRDTSSFPSRSLSKRSACLESSSRCRTCLPARRAFSAFEEQLS